VQALGVDMVLGVPARIGMGYGISGPEFPLGPNPRTCFWGGWGGSIAVNDLDSRTTTAFMMNKMGAGTVGDERAGAILVGVYAGLAS
jgi:CubicO group peptidase (beta-lactamase class C family)